MGEITISKKTVDNNPRKQCVINFRRNLIKISIKYALSYFEQSINGFYPFHVFR